jgi:pyruvate/oxaloacetate carboxyltransferase
VTICLSDTCGTLTAHEFEQIVSSFRLFKNRFISLSLHLHVISDREKEIESIIHKALENGITEFDTSLLETGGCAKVIGTNNIKPNLSYPLYYHSLISFIKKRSYNSQF